MTQIQEIPQEERPRERLNRLGPEALSSIELIAILLGSGTRGSSVLDLAKELLARFGGLEPLAEATVQELCETRGMGRAKAIQLRAAFGLVCRLRGKECSTHAAICHPEDAYQVVKKELEKDLRERFVALFLDVRLRLIKQETISIGTLTRSLIHPRELFYPAIRYKAHSIIVAHNHPSGDPTPSKEDITTTRVLVEAGKLVGIPLKDHLIVGRGSWCSLEKMGVLDG